MLNAMKRAVTERIRCAKHNWLDDVRFKTSYRGGTYFIHTADGLTLKFPHNPYSAFWQIEGYLGRGMWTVGPGMCVVDAGGYRGEFALYCSKRVGPAGQVVVLEPDPQSVRK